MNPTVVNAVNSGVTWLIAAMSVAAYFVTRRRTGERWPLWVVLSTGWALLGIVETMLAAGASMSWSETMAIWLASYVLVMASLLLLFLKLVALKRTSRRS